MFDLQSLSIAANYLRYGNYKDAVEILLKMNSKWKCNPMPLVYIFL